MSLARKINTYLQSGTPDGSARRVHATKMDSWLSILEAQMAASMPRVVKLENSIPDANETWAWVERLCEQALDAIDFDISQMGHMSHATAKGNQRAIIAALVTGCFTPPPRLHVLKTLIHPSYTGKQPCIDPDCRLGATCVGNHILLETLPPPPEDQLHLHDWQHFDYLTTDITNVVIHHKNDR